MGSADTSTFDGKFLVALDGGGTKTEICVYDMQKERSLSSVFGSSNYKALGLPTVRKNLLDGLNEACEKSAAKPEDIALCLMGISGCDTDEDCKVYERIMLGSGIPVSRVLILNDSEMIFRSLASEPGLCIVAGTGSIVFGFPANHEKVRAGGWGAPLSDQGSGYWIGAELIRRYLDWLDGVGEWNSFFQVIEARWKTQDALHTAANLACLDTNQAASLAKDVMDAASNGNTLCLKVVDKAAGIVSKLAAAVYQKLGIVEGRAISVVEVGSLFRDSYFEKKIQKNIRKLTAAANLRFLNAVGAPAESGILYAKKLYREKNIESNA